jgi:hypothetical protein
VTARDHPANTRYVKVDHLEHTGSLHFRVCLGDHADIAEPAYDVKDELVNDIG